MGTPLLLPSRFQAPFLTQTLANEVKMTHHMTIDSSLCRGESGKGTVPRTCGKMNKVPGARKQLQKEFKSFKDANSNGVHQSEEPLSNATPPWIIASRKTAPGQHETETSTFKSASPKHTGSTNTYPRGGYVPKRYRRKKGWILRWLAIFGIGLDHIILEDSLAEEVGLSYQQQQPNPIHNLFITLTLV